MVVITRDEVDPLDDEELIEMARITREHAYAWRSGFEVGAALQLEGGTWSAGANIEVHGMIPSVHAEMMAFFNAVQDVGPDRLREDAETIAVSCSDEGGHVPCALCLHTMSEFVDDIRIITDDGGVGDAIAYSEYSLDDQYVDAYRPGDHD